MTPRHSLWRYKDVAAHLNVNERTVRRYVRAGKLQSMHLSRRCVRFRPSDVQQFVQQISEGLEPLDANPVADPQGDISTTIQQLSLL